MGLQSEIQSLSPSALIELFELDMTPKGGTKSYFHAGTNALMQPVTWQGVQYVALPIETEGFDVSSKGVLPRPKMRIANINGLFSAEVRAKDDLIGCKVTRRRTFARYLDAVNFPNGNPYADPNQKFQDDVWFVDRKVNENKYMIEWELASVFDLQGVMLPYRQVIQNTCPWKYRGAECGYTGTAYFDRNDNAVGSASGDQCGKRLKSCEIRFAGSSFIPFGGFPGATRNG